MRIFPRQARYLLFAALALLALIAAGVLLIRLTDTQMTREDRVDAVRKMVDWALVGTPLPGWDGKNPWLEETRNAKTVAVVYRYHDEGQGRDRLIGEPKAERDRHPLTFSDARVKVVEVPVKGGAIGGEADVTLWLESDGRLDAFNPTMTLWTPSMKADYRVACEWRKQSGALTIRATPEWQIPGQGWVPFGAKGKP
jgi:hypothetical protein